MHLKTVSDLLKASAFTATNRFPRVTITPFSVEKESEGSPWMFQSLTVVGLDKNTAKLNPGVHGISNFCT